MPAVLAVGVGAEWLETAESKGYEIGKRNDPAQIKISAAQARADWKEQYPNTLVEGLPINPDDPASLEQYTTILKSRKWDAISIGGGVRTIPQLGHFFTALVHTAIREQPGAVLLFPILPEEVISCIKKYLPHLD